MDEERRSHDKRASRSVKHQGKVLLFGRVPLLELLSGEQVGKWHHCVLHFQDATFLLVDMGGIYNQTLQVVDRKRA